MVISTIARGASANPAHAVTVVLAIILMVVHAVWATVVLVRENREAIARFHASAPPCGRSGRSPTSAGSWANLAGAVSFHAATSPSV